MLDADDVFCPRLLEYSSNKLRVTRSNEDKLKLTLVLFDHLLELLSADKLAITLVIFEDEEVTLTFILVLKFRAHLYIIE